METHNVLAVLLCENVYLQKVLTHTNSLNIRLQEQLQVAHLALKTMNSLSHKAEHVKQLSQKIERLALLEEDLEREIQDHKEKEDDTIWLQTHINYLKEENRLAKLSLENQNNKKSSDLKTLLQDQTSI